MPPDPAGAPGEERNWANHGMTSFEVIPRNAGTVEDQVRSRYPQLLVKVSRMPGLRTDARHAAKSVGCDVLISPDDEQGGS
jgi:hypothetical protein